MYTLSFSRSRLITGFLARWTRLVSLVEQELLTLPEHLSPPPVVSGVRVTRSLLLLIVVCPFVLFLLAIVLSVLLRYTDSYYPFAICKFFLIITCVILKCKTIAVMEKRVWVCYNIFLNKYLIFIAMGKMCCIILLNNISYVHSHREKGANSGACNFFSFRSMWCHPGLTEVYVPQSLVFFVNLFFVSKSLFSVFRWPFYCLPFFYLRLHIMPLVSSNASWNNVFIY